MHDNETLQGEVRIECRFHSKSFRCRRNYGFVYLPTPWILLCGRDKTPTEVEMATYKVVKRKEFCECSLTTGSFQLDETLVKCTPEIFNEADGKFESYFAINKIIFNYLQAERDVQLDRSVVQALSRLLTVKPEYDWTPLNWYVNPDLPDNVINQQPTAVIADLMGVMEHIITEGQEQAYQSEVEYRNAQTKFKEFIKNAEGWQKLEFVSSILGLIALVALVVITIFRSRIVESIILGSAVMDEYKFVSPSAVKGLTLPPAYLNLVEFKPPTLPPDWGNEGVDGHQKVAATMSAWITIILIIIASLAILYAIQKVQIRIISTESMFSLVPIQHNSPRHRKNGHFCRSGQLSFSRSNVGTLHNSSRSSVTIKDHRLPNCI